MDTEIKIEPASLADAAALLEIYAPYVTETAITFEYEVPSLEEFRRRMSGVLNRYPWLVACIDGQIAGYAYASPFKGRRDFHLRPPGHDPPGRGKNPPPGFGRKSEKAEHPEHERLYCLSADGR